MKILYLAWLGSNNLGDVYMWEIFRKLSLQYLDQQRFEVIPPSPYRSQRSSTRMILLF